MMGVNEGCIANPFLEIVRTKSCYFRGTSYLDYPLDDEAIVPTYGDKDADLR